MDTRMTLPPDRIRVVIADCHAMYREALRSVLEQDGSIEVVGEACSGRDVIEKTNRLKPELLLLDYALPSGPGLEILRRLEGSSKVSRVVFLVDSVRKSEVLETLKLGGWGMLPKHSSTDLLLRCIRSVVAGEYWIGHENIMDLIEQLKTGASTAPAMKRSNGFRLTSREIDIIDWIVEGCTNKEIAEKLSICEQTVKHHLTSIFDKVGVSNRLELALLAMRERLTSEPQSLVG